MQNYINWVESAGINSGLSSIGFISAATIGTPNFYTGDNQIVLTIGGAVPTMTFTMEQLQSYPKTWTTFTYSGKTVTGMGVPLIDILNAANVPATDGVLGWGYDTYTATSGPPSGITGTYLDYYTGAGGLNQAGKSPGTAQVLPYTYLQSVLAQKTAVCFTKGGNGMAEISLIIPEASAGSYMSQELGYIQVEPVSTTLGVDQPAFDSAVIAACNLDNPHATMPSPWAAIIDPSKLPNQ